MPTSAPLYGFVELSAKNERVSTLRRLIGRRSARSESGVLVVEGAKVLQAALEAGAATHAVFSDTADQATLQAVASLLDDHGSAADRWLLPAGTLRSVTDTMSPQPIAAVVTAPLAGIDQIARECVASAGHVVVGCDIRDPGNVGTLIRSAEASGAAGVVLIGTSVDVTAPKVVRSSAGGLFFVRTAVESDPVRGLDALRSSGVRVLGTTVRGSATAHDQPGALRGPVAFVLGNEAQGLDDALDSHIDGWITIPMAGRSESLNVGMAAAVLAFESARQQQIGRQE